VSKSYITEARKNARYTTDNMICSDDVSSIYTDIFSSTIRIKRLTTMWGVFITPGFSRTQHVNLGKKCKEQEI